VCRALQTAAGGASGESGGGGSGLSVGRGVVGGAGCVPEAAWTTAAALWVCGHVYNARAAAGAEKQAEGHSDGYGRKRGVHQVNGWIAAERIRRTKGTLEDSRHSSSERVEEAPRGTGFGEGNHRAWQAQGMKKGNKRASVSAFVTHCVRVYRRGTPAWWHGSVLKGLRSCRCYCLGPRQVQNSG